MPLADRPHSDAQPTKTFTSTSTGATATPSATPSASTATIECPLKGNGTTFEDDGTGKTFAKFCGIDYSGKGQADDIGSTKTRTMDECISACAAEDGCTGCGWGYIDGDDGDLHHCYMKANLTKSHIADGKWAFAVLQGNLTKSSRS